MEIRRIGTEKNGNEALFEEAPVLQAVISLIVPAIISQVITVIYNVADTFFIGQIGDPHQVAAVSICMPLFVLLTGMANLFGIGGASLISRSLGIRDFEKAKRASVFSLWTAGGAAFLYGILIYFGRCWLFPRVGANDGTFDYCTRYAFWVITIGAVPTVLSATFAHIVRAEGYSREASIGITMGGVLNILLDPLLISVFRLEIAGAAIATMLSNLVSTGYFILLIRRKRESIVLETDPRYYTLNQGIPSEVLLVGLPSAVMNISGVLSNVFMNRLMASFCNEAVAGIGIAKKVDLLTYAIATGITQAVIPMLGYNYSSRNYRRLKSVVRTDFEISISVATVCTLFLITCAGFIVRAFIDDPLTVSYGSQFQRIICLTGPCLSVSFVVITLFQAVGKKTAPLLLSLLRKGAVDIPFMYLMKHLAGIRGIAWATPIADVISMLVAVILFVPFWKKLNRLTTEDPA